MPSFVALEALSRDTRATAVEHVRGAVDAVGAVILDVNFLSSHAFCLTLEATRGAIAQLVKELEAKAFVIARAPKPEPASDGEAVFGTLAVTLFNDEPDEALEVPAVPG